MSTSTKQTTTEPMAYDRAIAYARERGAQDGRNAAGWYVQDAMGGRSWDRAESSSRRARGILAGIEAGDPAVLDGFPQPDLSGEWADSLTGPQLAEDAAWHALGYSDSEYYGPDAVERDADTLAELAGNLFTDVCDAYEAAFQQAAEDEIASAARAILE